MHRQDSVSSWSRIVLKKPSCGSVNGASRHSHGKPTNAVARKQQKARSYSPMVTSMPLGNKVVDGKAQQKERKKRSTKANESRDNGQGAQSDRSCHGTPNVGEMKGENQQYHVPFVLPFGEHEPYDPTMPRGRGSACMMTKMVKPRAAAGGFKENSGTRADSSLSSSESSSESRDWMQGISSIEAPLLYSIEAAPLIVDSAPSHKEL